MRPVRLYETIGRYDFTRLDNAKGAGEAAIGGKKLPNGLRLVRVDGKIVPRVSDLDVAFGIDLRGPVPRRMTNDEILEWRKVVNEAYNARVVTRVVKHGDLVSGRVFLNAPGAAEVPVNEVVYMYTSRSFVGSGSWDELLHSFGLPHGWWRPGVSLTMAC